MKVSLTNNLLAQINLSQQAEQAVPRIERVFSDLPGVSAIWDTKVDPQNRPLLILTVRDMAGSAKAVFSPPELAEESNFAKRLHILRRDLLHSTRRMLIGIRDQVVSFNQLEGLRQALNSIPNITEAGLKMDNRVSIRDQAVLLTNFTVEVEEPFATAVKEAIARSGFTIREMPLAGQPKVVDAVKRLATAHARDPELTPQHIVWFQLEDPKDIHLLEISENAFDPGDGSLQGIAFNAGDTVPGARSIVVYLASPPELRKAFEVNLNHPAVRALIERQYRVLQPDDAGASLQEAFPEMAGAAV